MVKNWLANAGDLRDVRSMPGSGRSPENEMANHSSILAWRIPLTEEPGGLSLQSHKESDMTEATNTHTHEHTESSFLQ